jgi:acetyl esterase
MPGVVPQLGHVVASVEYRLAPEHQFPEGLDDTYAVLTWLHANAHVLDADRELLAEGRHRDTIAVQ